MSSSENDNDMKDDEPEFDPDQQYQEISKLL